MNTKLRFKLADTALRPLTIRIVLIVGLRNYQINSIKLLSNPQVHAILFHNISKVKLTVNKSAYLVTYFGKKQKSPKRQHHDNNFEKDLDKLFDIAHAESFEKNN